MNTQAQFRHYQPPVTSLLSARERRTLRRRATLWLAAWCGICGLFIGLLIIHGVFFTHFPDRGIDWRMCFCGGMVLASAGMIVYFLPHALA